MIDEIKLLTQLQDELANARAKYWENDTDSFYGGMCSALEEVITIVNKQPAATLKEFLNSFYGRRGGFTLPANDSEVQKDSPFKEMVLKHLLDSGNYVDTDIVRNDSEEVQETSGYMPPMKEQILHYFRNLYYEDIREYNKLSTGLDKLAEETRAKAIEECYMKAKTLMEELSYQNQGRRNGNTHRIYCIQALEFLRQVAEQIKGGAKSE